MEKAEMVHQTFGSREINAISHGHATVSFDAIHNISLEFSIRSEE